MRAPARTKAVKVDALCQRCGQPFTYVRRARRRLTCSDCAVKIQRKQGAAWREENRTHMDALPAEYSSQLKRTIVGTARAINRVMKHVDDLPAGHRGEALGLLLVESIRRLDIGGVDGLPPGPLMGPMGHGDE